MQYQIGDRVTDEDGNIGHVAIVWNDGDICTIENDAAHPNPKKEPVTLHTDDCWETMLEAGKIGK